ncbi:MAG: hypothetical protein K5821_14350 [Nitrobacter sp.]|uniref:hypothetical protein n=1 Tax=Nitrobacter sp. TaxID=29420 RepID=UPI002602D458|nr:hypothetical protein [Nitrobacter sp.]MCV0387573.1 hypothetical protein [Nitrobacter sp.]
MLVRWALALGILLAPAPAGAQGHGHSHRGGQEVRIGNYEVELTVAGSEMTLHVNDTNDQKVNGESFSATAVVLAKGNQQMNDCGAGACGRQQARWKDRLRDGHQVSSNRHAADTKG